MNEFKHIWVYNHEKAASGFLFDHRNCFAFCMYFMMDGKWDESTGQSVCGVGRGGVGRVDCLFAFVGACVKITF